MNPTEEGPILRRWGFYANHRLAYAGVACLTPSRVLRLRFIETRQHAHTATLPERIQFEQLIQRLVLSEVEGWCGLGKPPKLCFEPFRLEEQQLASQLFGALAPKPIAEE
ncbi:MAG: hypothetical protein MUC91_14265 [Verrucomicrobia bacterium]|jgi:hypothetical protein|nr:hypothetical protein [Verrucomicrobiota bacterium]